jgi:replicative superfamily II helicase
VVVQAPTGSGKTYIFELLYPNLKTQAVLTVPTRALEHRIVEGAEPRGSNARSRAASKTTAVANDAS